MNKDTKNIGPYNKVSNLIKEYKNEINIEKLSGNVVKETMAIGIVLGLNIAMAEYEFFNSETKTCPNPPQ